MSFSLPRERGSSKRSRARYIFWTSLWNIVFYLHHVIELYRVHITLANLCVTRSGTMHLTLSCAVHCSWNVPFGQSEKGGRCVHIWFLTRVPSVHDFDSVTPLFSFTPISSVWLENSRVMLSKIQTEGTRARTREHTTTAIFGWVEDLSILIGFTFITYYSWQYVSICLILKMADDRRAMCHRFSKKSGHSVEWVRIVKKFLNQAFAGCRRVGKCPCTICQN
jgi:hypothetical protein